ncbi:UTP--glucose-1-phosphate uridylyltransferase GalU [Candidatus Peregrinibacteria bacterium]|nr:UTP--glucose-1-phosphate uridylyltransferase GalU [Candidatus Peregrinibacteria bacterium]
MKITKAVIPAAGLGTRFLPATKSQAKEMMPIVDKPCIQYLVEEAVASGIKEIIIITGRNKRTIEDHFDFSFELDAHLRKNKKLQALKELEKIEKMAKFIYVRQPVQLGDGHAILCAKELIKNEPFAVLFGDDIYDSKIPALAQMIKNYEKFKTPILALEEVPKEATNKYGIAGIKSKKNNIYEIDSLVEKPAPKDAPSNLSIVGKYIVTPDLLKTLEKAKSHSKDGEIRLIDGMREYIKTHKIHGCKIDGERFDTGDKLGYLKAVIHFGLKHKDLSKDLKTYLRKISK